MNFTDDLYMERCIELARLGAGLVAPNPMVGSVLVYKGRIIGEGFHQEFGQSHAEVNCLKSVSITDSQFISAATLYVSLEPCSHFGKTPPCSDLIIQKGIKRVVIGTIDPFHSVNGKGLSQLQTAGIEVMVGILEEKCKELNKRFFTFHQYKRPYVILKWAQSGNEKISSDTKERIQISHATTNRLVHKWRSDEASIMVGTNTAFLDDPSLDNRYWSGKSPVRLVLDLILRLPKKLTLFNHKQTTIIFSHIGQANEDNLIYSQIKKGPDLIQDVLHVCFERNLQSILVEGGAKLLQSFINANLWDEARIITHDKLIIDQGINAPVLQNQELMEVEKITGDTIQYFNNKMNQISI